MEFSPQQAKAVDAVSAWLAGGNSTPQVFRLFGFAGTGKTTLAMHLASQQDGEVRFGAYTGKAASVLRRKGCTSATTIHSMIYGLIEPDEEFIKNLKQRIVDCKDASLLSVLKEDLRKANMPNFELRPDALDDVDLVVIDEVSMVGEEIGADLLSFGKKILVLGDPFQLPPVGGGGYFTNGKPDVLLTEIHRQAQGNPIIAMATLVRNGGYLGRGAYGHCKVVDRRTYDLSPQEFDQLIVGMNKTRKSLNAKYRDLLGWNGIIPEVNDKLICLKNNRTAGLLNGTQWRVLSCEDRGHVLRMEILGWEDPLLEEFTGEPRSGKLVDAFQFDVKLDELPWYDRRRAEEFDFGYAITCHKSQGSQWKKVFIQNEGYVFREDSARWLYTALTRAEETVVVAR